jgi:hypothetical protein
LARDRVPSLLLNYFGQGALLLRDPAAVQNPFYLLVPSWGLYPLVVLASTATIHRLAGSDLGCVLDHPTSGSARLSSAHPRAPHLSGGNRSGYVPRINSALLILVILLILGFKTQTISRAAYGIAVDRHDDHHHHARLRLCPPGLEMEFAPGCGCVWRLPRIGPDLPQRQSLEDRTMAAGFPVLVAAIVCLADVNLVARRQWLTELRARSTLPLESFLQG